MKILHCIFSFTVGGAESMLVDIVNEQVKTDDVTLLIVNDYYDRGLLAALDPRVKVLLMKRREGANPLILMVKLNWRLRRLNPDVIHVHNHKLPGLIRGLDRKLVFTAHCLNVPMTYVGRVRIIAISDAVRGDIVNRRPEADVTVIQNAICAEAVRVRDMRPFGERLRVVQVGSLNVDYKGQDYLIEAVGILKKRGIDNVSVDFIGNGPHRVMLEELAGRIGVSDRVNFLGERNRAYVYEHLRDYDLMCHPARYEGFGLVIAEGMAAWLPVAVPSEGGPYEVVGRGRFGTVFAPRDAEACADAIKSVYDDYGKALSRVADAAGYVAANYSIATMVARYRRFYRRED